MNGAWAVYENNVNLVGYVERTTDHGWTFRETYDAPQRWRVSGTDVLVGTTVRCSTPISPEHPELLFGLCLPKLSVPARVALSLWLVDAKPPA